MTYSQSLSLVSTYWCKDVSYRRSRWNWQFVWNAQTQTSGVIQNEKSWCGWTAAWPVKFKDRNYIYSVDNMTRIRQLNYTVCFIRQENKTVKEDLTHFQEDIGNISSFRSRYLEVTKNSRKTTRLLNQQSHMLIRQQFKHTTNSSAVSLVILLHRN